VTKTQRQIAGTAPHNSNGVIYDGATDPGSTYLVGWVMYRLPTGRAPWMDIKLVRPARGMGPANHFLSWHETEQRFGTGADLDRVPAALAGDAVGVMREIYPHLTEDDMVGALACAAMLA